MESEVDKIKRIGRISNLRHELRFWQSVEKTAYLFESTDGLILAHKELRARQHALDQLLAKDQLYLDLDPGERS